MRSPPIAVEQAWTDQEFSILGPRSSASDHPFLDLLVLDLRRIPADKADQFPLATRRAHDLARLLEDAERWNAYAAKMNAKALAAGIVTAEQLERDRQATEANLARLRARLVQP